MNSKQQSPEFKKIPPSKTEPQTQDVLAKLEHYGLAKNLDLETEELMRRETTRRIYSQLMNWIVRVIGFIVIIALVSVAWHHLTPTGWAWLDEKQLTSLRTFLLSGAVISAVTIHIQRIL